jgi:hypothetical protein
MMVKIKVLYLYIIITRKDYFNRFILILKLVIIFILVIYENSEIFS